MGNVKIGGYTTPHSLPGYPAESRDENGNWEIERRFWIARANVGTYLPAHNASTDENGATVQDRASNTLYLKRTNIQPGQAPDMVEVGLVYRLKTVGLTLKRPKDNPRTVNLRSVDIPIDDDALQQYYSGADITSAKEAGWESLPVYSVEYTYTSLDNSFAWTEAAVVALANTITSPTGLNSPTAGKWRMTGAAIEETDDTTILRKNWEYNAGGFPSP